MRERSAGALPGRYWRQWWASATSNLGDGINFVAMPLLAFSLTDDERLLSLTAFATMVPWLLFALPIGVAVDRIDRRRLMVGASLARLVVYGLVALAATSGTISIWALVVALAVVGSCEVVFDSSAQAFLPALVDADELPRANGYLFAAEVVLGSILGLSIGALLFELDPGVPFGVNALTFGVAAVLIASIRLRTAGGSVPRTGGREPAVGVGVGVGADVAAGLRWLRADPLLLTLALLLAVANFGLMLGQGIFVKYAAVELGLAGTGYGLLLLVAAVGAAGGGLAGHRVHRRLGTTWSIVVPYVVFGVGQLVFALAPVTWAVAVAGFTVGLAITTWNVVTVSLRQRVIPAELFGRVNSVYRWLGTGASAIGALAGGQLAYHTDLRMPYLVAGVITLAALVVGLGPVRRGVDRLGAPGQREWATPAPPSIT